MMEQGENVTLLTQKKGKSQANRKGKHQIPPKADIKKDEKCFFCKKKEHVKKKCLKFQIWLEKKDNPTSFVCYESNMVNVNTNSWWIDSGSTIHISNSLQGKQNLRKLVRSEQFILSRNKMGSHIGRNKDVLFNFRWWFCFRIAKDLLCTKFLTKLDFSF